TVVNQQVVTNGFDDDTSVFQAKMRVFNYSFQEDPGDPFFTQDPGFNALANNGLPGTGTDINGFSVVVLLPFVLATVMLELIFAVPALMVNVAVAGPLVLELFPNKNAVLTLRMPVLVGLDPKVKDPTAPPLLVPEMLYARPSVSTLKVPVSKVTTQ